MFDNYKNVVKEYNEFKYNFEKKMQDSFKDIFNEFFEACPLVKTIAWHQYTPYFNDGDECIFRVGEICMYGETFDSEYEIKDKYGYLEQSETDVMFTEPSKYDYEHIDSSTYSKTRVDEWNKLPQELKDIQPLIREFVDIMALIPDEVYKSSFGNHVTIIVTREGISVEEYSHD